MAPDETPPNPYAGSTYSNTHPAWLQNAQGALNADVEANLDDLKGFSANLAFAITPSALIDARE